MNYNTQDIDGLSNILNKRSSVWFYFINFKKEKNYSIVLEDRMMVVFGRRKGAMTRKRHRGISMYSLLEIIYDYV